MDNVDRSYGVDTNGPTPFDDSLMAVRVPENNLHFTDEVLSRLRASVDPSSNHEAMSLLSQ